MSTVRGHEVSDDDVIRAHMIADRVVDRLVKHWIEPISALRDSMLPERTGVINGESYYPRRILAMVVAEEIALASVEPSA